MTIFVSAASPSEHRTHTDTRPNIGHGSERHDRLQRGTFPDIPLLSHGIVLTSLASRSQFAGLWKYIKDWQNVYRHFDRDRSGSIDTNELHDALRQFGYNLSPQLLQLVERKYGEPPQLYLPSPLSLHPSSFALLFLLRTPVKFAEC